MSWFDKITGKTRFAVSRISIHLKGKEIVPLLGILNAAGREAIASDGDLEVLGQELEKICQSLLQYDIYWYAAANEGDVLWNEGEAGDYVNELFTDSGSRYLSKPNYDQSVDDDLSLVITQNLVIMLTVAYEGEDKTIETDLSNMSALRIALKSLINLHYQNRFRAIHVHFSPAQLGDDLTDDQVLTNFTELIPL